ncbi:hypothetical protein OHC33_000458 [Knufia fluminis]|uniref:Amine oxidase domain-containing protein n=1 Tax=Knufia fluminis TaxID=191047 RepID=A0AAN8EQE3_9EURO|nr:hypothetical protein OHC33_000458 [Knufia fluminis]
MPPKKIAIVGSGRSGIGALWALRSTDHEVHLFEASPQLGGQTNTIAFEGRNGKETQVDLGTITMNTTTNANFIRFLKHMGVTTKTTEMSFGVTRDAGDFEWATTSLATIFAQQRSFLSPGRWRLLFDIIRFNQFALDAIVIEDESKQRSSAPSQSGPARSHPGMSIREYLDLEGYSQTFKNDYLIPMTAMLWSRTPNNCALDVPASVLVRIMWNHHLLDTFTKAPDYLTVPDSTGQYIEAVMKDFPQERVHLDSKVTAAIPEVEGKVTLRVKDEDLPFDHVVLAIRGDQALDILKPVATKQELNVLSGFRTYHNIAVLHSDLSLMPQRPLTWSACNFITESPFPPTGTSNMSRMCLTYWMNLVQDIRENEFGPVLVTLNPLHPPKAELTQGVWECSCSSYNERAVRSQQLVSTIQNRRGISYCGAWTDHSFHENGFSSGLAVAQNHLGAKLPFDLVNPASSRGPKPILTLKDHAARLLIQAIQLLIRIVGIFLDTLHASTGRLEGKSKLT